MASVCCRRKLVWCVWYLCVRSIEVSQVLVDGMEGFVLLRHVGVDLLRVAVMRAVGRPGTVSALTLKAVERSSAGLVTLLVRVRTTTAGTPYR